MLTTGFDAPNIDAICLLRPTHSPGLYYQMVGRGFLTLARQTFSKQRRPSADGKTDPLGIKPKVLLVPASLEILADLLMGSTTLNEAASTPKSDKNPHANKFGVVSSDYLDNEDYTGSSDKAWYLLAEPNAVPTIEVVFLNGKQVPTVERSDMVFNKLGIEFRGYLDFGVKEQHPCATRLENVPFAWWRGEVKRAAGS